MRRKSETPKQAEPARATAPEGEAAKKPPDEAANEEHDAKKQPAPAGKAVPTVEDERDEWLRRLPQTD